MIERPVSRQPIPSTASCVYRGKLFDVYQWRQKLFDGTFATFEKLKRPDTAYVLPVTASGRILLVQQEQPGSPKTIGLIGGRIEKDEQPDEAARRELEEEAGLRSLDLDLWDSYQFLPKLDWAIYTFVAREYESLPPRPDRGEQIKILEVSFDELIRLAGTEQFGDVEVALRLLRLAADPRRLAAAEQSILARR